MSEVYTIITHRDGLTEVLRLRGTATHAEALAQVRDEYVEMRDEARDRPQGARRREAPRLPHPRRRAGGGVVRRWAAVMIVASAVVMAWAVVGVYQALGWVGLLLVWGLLLLSLVLPQWVAGAFILCDGAGSLIYDGLLGRSLGTRGLDVVEALVGLWLLVDWWRRKGRRRWAARLAGYKARAARARLLRRARAAGAA